ncbi:MAG: hypothetical protein M0R21_09750 [Lentimicrobiaceae bacterium]|jgi:hypothetical protein|nr:hypothetical protein [Lentimicrobiaceae bacterium]
MKKQKAMKAILSKSESRNYEFSKEMSGICNSVQRGKSPAIGNVSYQPLLYKKTDD